MSIAMPANPMATTRIAIAVNVLETAVCSVVRPGSNLGLVTSSSYLSLGGASQALK